MTSFVDFKYLMQQVDSGKIKKCWRKMKRRQFKKHGWVNFETDDLFIVATAAKVGDIYHEHEQNHRICKIDNTRDPEWISSGLKWHGGKYRRSKRGKVKSGGYIINEQNQGICGCGLLQLPVSVEAAAEMAITDCLMLTDKKRLYDLHTKLGWHETDAKFEKRWETYGDIRDNPVFMLYVDYLKQVVADYDKNGPSAVVDSDGVVLHQFEETKKKIWQMCRQAE